MTPAFANFIRTARDRPQLWRLVAGIVVAIAVYLGWLGLIFSAVGLWFGPDQTFAALTRLASGSAPGPMLLLLFTFFGMAMGPAVAVRLLHRRTAGSLIGRGAVVVHDFCVAVLTVATIYGLSLSLWSLSFDAVPNMPPRQWLILLPLAVLGVLVQTLAEEMVFRGYLMQQLAARFRSPLIWLLLPAVIFGAIHFDPTTNGANNWAVIGAVSLFGLIAGDLTRRTGSLGASWGMHFANNVLALLILPVSGALDGLGLFQTPYRSDDPDLTGMIGGDLIGMLLVWLILTRLLRR